MSDLLRQLQADFKDKHQKLAMAVKHNWESVWRHRDELVLITRAIIAEKDYLKSYVSEEV